VEIARPALVIPATFAENITAEGSYSAPLEVTEPMR